LGGRKDINPQRFSSGTGGGRGTERLLADPGSSGKAAIKSGLLVHG